jgi:V/A-type H+-transporting ATPase subunit I
MVLGIAPVVGVILMLLILVLGHTFNLAINLLGAFVHPLRLEFVEFFGKFYEDGGRPFKPMRVDSRTVIIDDGQSPRLRGKGGGK